MKACASPWMKRSVTLLSGFVVAVAVFTLLAPPAEASHDPWGLDYHRSSSTVDGYSWWGPSSDDDLSTFGVDLPLGWSHYYSTYYNGSTWYYYCYLWSSGRLSDCTWVEG